MRVFRNQSRNAGAGKSAPRASRLARLLVWVVAAASTTGCSAIRGISNNIQYNDTVNDFVMGWRNSVWARQAWEERKHCFRNEQYLGSFGAGFRAGYESVAGGGNGCPPPLPPRTYWSWKYQTPEGQAKTAAWFAGFPHGARAAEEEKAGFFQDIQVSYAIERQYSPEFQSGEIVDTSEAQPPAPEDPAAAGTAYPLPGNAAAHSTSPSQLPVHRAVPPVASGEYPSRSASYGALLPQLSPAVPSSAGEPRPGPDQWPR